MEKSLWEAADQFRANSGLKAQDYSGPILGLIFLRFADARFMPRWRALKEAGGSERRGTREEDPNAYQSEGLLYLPPGSRYQELLDLPEGADISGRLNEAMGLIEQHNSKLAGVLPRSYNLFTPQLLSGLLKRISEIPTDLEFDAFGRIYAYFLREFARSEGQKGGEYFTPTSLVVLITEIVEPFAGRLLDPALRFLAECERRLRLLYRQIDRSHRDWSEAQIGFLANIVRLYRGEAVDVTLGGEEAQRWIEAYFGSEEGKAPQYRDIAGLCKAATLEAIEVQGWSLNTGRYVGVAAGEDLSDEDFKAALETLNEELENLNAQARGLGATIAANLAGLLQV